MTAEGALVKLGESTGAAVEAVLRALAGDTVDRGPALPGSSTQHPLRNAPMPAVAASVSYVDGVKGGNVFVMTRLAARRLAGAMIGAEPDDPEAELSELELSAVGEAMNQMMAAAAGATSAVLGMEVEIGTPETRFFGSPDEAVDAFEQPPYSVTVPFTMLGEPSRLVQLVPAPFVVRMTKALDDLAAEFADEAPSGPTFSEDSVRAIPVRVWAELGRARLTLQSAVALPPGTVLALDRGADDPVDLYVNGRAFARGRLTLVDEEWAVEIDEVFPSLTSQTMHEGGSKPWHAFSS